MNQDKIVNQPQTSIPVSVTLNFFPNPLQKTDVDRSCHTWHPGDGWQRRHCAVAAVTCRPQPTGQIASDPTCPWWMALSPVKMSSQPRFGDQNWPLKNYRQASAPTHTRAMRWFYVDCLPNTLNVFNKEKKKGQKETLEVQKVTLIEKSKGEKKRHRESCHGNALKMTKQQLITTSTHRYDAYIMGKLTGHLLQDLS